LPLNPFAQEAASREGLIFPNYPKEFYRLRDRRRRYLCGQQAWPESKNC
jgi:hypothetical protein